MNNIYEQVAKAIKDLDFEKFQLLMANNLISLSHKFIEIKGVPQSLLCNISVMLKAKNKDPYLQSLFSGHLWKLYSGEAGSVNKIEFKNEEFDLLALLFLRESNQDNLNSQINLFFDIIEQEPGDFFLKYKCQLIYLLQNPFISDLSVLFERIKNKKNGFDFISGLKAKEQCYYNKESLLSVLRKIIENRYSSVSINAIYGACNNLIMRSVCHSTGSLEISWMTYSPKEVQDSLELILMNKLGLSECKREHIPLIVASKYYRELKTINDSLLNCYRLFLEKSIFERMNLDCECQGDFFVLLKNLNVPEETYICLENRYEIEKHLLPYVVMDNDNIFEINKL